MEFELVRDKMILMGVIDWISHNWFTFLQSLGIIGGLFFTGISLRIDSKVRRVQNLISITEQHRDIWTRFREEGNTRRILEREVDLELAPATEEERIFVHLLILHLNSSFHAIVAGVFLRPEGLRRDIAQFFSLPIPRHVWRKSKLLLDSDFVRFVEEALKESD